MQSKFGVAVTTRYRVECRRKGSLLWAARAKAHELANPASDDALIDDAGVNLELWGRGEAHYEPGRVFAAIRSRYNKFVRTFADAIDFLVFDACLIPEAEASRELFESHQRPRLRERS